MGALKGALSAALSPARAAFARYFPSHGGVLTVWPALRGGA
jgi:hypothetical protein